MCGRRWHLFHRAGPATGSAQSHSAIQTREGFYILHHVCIRQDYLQPHSYISMYMHTENTGWQFLWVLIVCGTFLSSFPQFVHTVLSRSRMYMV